MLLSHNCYFEHAGAMLSDEGGRRECE
jgi:hypothetical protein